jgi:hypothetical protein
MIIVNESAGIGAFLSSFHTAAAAGARRFLLHGEDPAAAFLARLDDDSLYSHMAVSHTSFDVAYVAATAGVITAEAAYREDWDAVLIFENRDVAEVFKRIEHRALLPTIKSDALTFDKGRIDTWRDEFKPEHLKAFNNRFGDLLAVYGYPADNPSEPEIPPGYFASNSQDHWRKDEMRFFPNNASPL